MSLKKQILVVEDNQINREMLRMILSGQYDVIEADSGQTALNLLRDRKDNIALILLDVMMPVMDGYTFLELVKQDPELALIPVIVTTQNDSEADELAALEHGATDFVPKPYRPQIILHRVASLINLRENAAMVNQLRYDRLTGLYSKEFFYKQAQEQMRTHPERQYTIICSNVENFKLYNDVFGIAAGDRLLRAIAKMFLELKGRDEICGRFNADRFMLLLSQEHRTANYDHLVETGQQMLRTAKNTVMKWGVYEVASEGVSVEQMCDRAFLAADSIRGQYNTHFSVYDDSLRSKLLREQVITESMEAALAQRQFQVYLSPSSACWTTDWPVPRRWCAGSILRWASCPRVSLSPSLKRTASSPSWTATSGRRRAACSTTGRAAGSPPSPCPSTSPALTSIRQTWPMCCWV